MNYLRPADFCKSWNLVFSMDRSEVLFCIEDLYIKMYRNKLKLLRKKSPVH